MDHFRGAKHSPREVAPVSADQPEHVHSVLYRERTISLCVLMFVIPHQNRHDTIEKYSDLKYKTLFIETEIGKDCNGVHFILRINSKKYQNANY